MKVDVYGMMIEESAEDPEEEDITEMHGAVAILCSCRWSREGGYQGERQVTSLRLISGGRSSSQHHLFGNRQYQDRRRDHLRRM